jgi:Putative enzyme of poly-gamma-glutamate biosynthesis (capsule formation)
MQYRKIRAAAAALALCLAWLSCASGPRGGSVALAADRGFEARLDSISSENPLPAGWRLAEKGEGGAAVTLHLRALPKAESRTTEASASIGALCGTAYLAAAVDLADPRYSVSAEEAQGIGLEDLEAIEPPRRALAVGGLWPGEEGYAFERELRLSGESLRPGKAIPAAISSWMEAAAERERGKAQDPLVLAAAGDIQVGEAQAAEIIAGRSSLESLIAPEVLARIRGADFAVANLESPVSGRGEPNPKKRYQFRMPPGSSSMLRDAGFDLVLLANNHGFDYGPEAFDDTLRDLEAAGLLEVGAGRDAAEAQAARVFDAKGGQKLAFVGLAFYPNERYGFTLGDAAAGPGRPGIAVDEEAALAAVRAAAAAGATVVVMAHGGTEYQTRPSAAAVSLYDRLAEAGAALVLGGHPHLLQGCAARNGGLIEYSLGNFVFTYEEEPKSAWKSGLVDFLIYGGKARGVRLFPIVAAYYGTTADTGLEAAEKRFSGLSAELANTKE